MTGEFSAMAERCGKLKCMEDSGWFRAGTKSLGNKATICHQSSHLPILLIGHFKLIEKFENIMKYLFQLMDKTSAYCWWWQAAFDINRKALRLWNTLFDNESEKCDRVNSIMWNQYFFYIQELILELLFTRPILSL